jgi:uncharacterized protein YjbJ (UPF0337 family)
MGKNMDKIKGRVKQAAGDLSADRGLRREGVTDEARGHAKDAADHAKRAVDQAVRGLKTPRK